MQQDEHVDRATSVQSASWKEELKISQEYAQYQDKF